MCHRQRRRRLQHLRQVTLVVRRQVEHHDECRMGVARHVREKLFQRGDAPRRRADRHHDVGRRRGLGRSIAWFCAHAISSATLV
jgi:hypothetical protein